MRNFRYAVFSLAALLVLSLGFVLIPPKASPPAEPPFSEAARAAALAETLTLRSARLGLALPSADNAAGTPADAAARTPGGVMDPVVTLLTIQARALLLPERPAPGRTAGPSVATPSRPAGAGPSAAPLPSGPPAYPTPAEFAAALAASGQQRLTDAQTADGGMARLLAGVGTAQLLAAEELGANGKQPPHSHNQDGTGPDGPTAPATSSACPASPPAAGGADLGAALTAAVEAERETVYGYQAALTRLPAEGAGPASEFLAQHQELAAQAEAHSLMHCRTAPPQAPGYVLGQDFLDAPAAGLATLETATLPVYGDVVALASGTTRAWALAALQEAARRARHWGAAPNPVPGIVLDEAQLPQLPG